MDMPQLPAPAGQLMDNACSTVVTRHIVGVAHSSPQSPGIPLRGLPSCLENAPRFPHAHRPPLLLLRVIGLYVFRPDFCLDNGATVTRLANRHNCGENEANA